MSRTITVSGTLLIVLFGLMCAALVTGDFVVPLRTVLATLTGQGTRATEFIVLDLRLPRALTAIGAGAALGAAGAIFQSITRNPLGSPDVIGFTQGASAGAVLELTVGAGNTLQVALAAVAGGAVTAAVVYLLSFRHGVAGYRLVLVGIGASALLLAVVRYLLTRANLTDAFTAAVWLVGSLNGVGYAQVGALAGTLIILIPAALLLARPLNMLELGDDSATALGVRAERSRVLAIAVAVLLSAVATACIGPVAFVALSAPQLARRLTRATGVGILPAALMGALVLSVSDFSAEHLLATELPVGVCTGAVGGIYLAWLLARQWRAR